MPAVLDAVEGRAEVDWALVVPPVPIVAGRACSAPALGVLVAGRADFDQCCCCCLPLVVLVHDGRVPGAHT